ncbi:kinase-like protein [Obba rivulosa]|uniref:Kinase-like protein n=1 Tax=Obba rivulosa TaxID=1052685 RepID=A0A8E2ATG0_9APHY|nr:kinase-like protein [Obba rivulosa]
MAGSVSDPTRGAALEPGTVIGSTSLTLALVRPLGQGAFSSVWLARDVAGQVGALELTRRSSLLRSKSGKRGRLARVDGTKPRRSALSGQRVPAERRERAGGGEHEKEKERARKTELREGGRMVAVKMTERALCDKNARTRVSFVREVEVLRHISHPSIVSYLHSFSTASHHCLVLEHVSGGELFDLIDSTESHACLDEPLLRRMFGELCKAVGWMHGVGLVHRDIKLENILLTCNPLRQPLPHGPLVKLSDFGLSRFIDPAAPLLTTLCGSESYAAPELVMGRPYDGRETDAWACGVVLFALAARRLPFDKPGAQAPKHEQPETQADAARRRLENRRERKALLVRIAKGEYEWPEVPAPTSVEDETLRGPSLVRSAGVRGVVSRLLVRDPAKRAKIIDLWEDEWMRGEGAPLAPAAVFALDGESDGDAEADPGAEVPAQRPCVPDQEVEHEAEGEAEAECPCAEDGVLVDGHDIGPGSVARQEH